MASWSCQSRIDSRPLAWSDKLVVGEGEVVGAGGVGGWGEGRQARAGPRTIAQLLPHPHRPKSPPPQAHPRPALAGKGFAIEKSPAQALTLLTIPVLNSLF